MYTQDIIGQNLIKKQLKKMLVEKTYPQSQIFIDPNGYGGLPLAINNSLNLIYGLEKMEEYENNKIPFSNLINHPDLHFVYPSITKSKMSKFLLQNLKTIDSISKLHPLKRLGEGSDTANLTKFLLSKDSSWITGQIIGVDGGRSNIA